MKHFNFFLMILFSLSASAQAERDFEKEFNSSFLTRNKAIGIIAQNNYGLKRFKGDMLMGLQYKYWLKPSLALRALAAFNPSSESMPRIQTNLGGDTISSLYSSDNVDMLALGLGIETQRHFYKRVYMTAGVETVVGFGKGKRISFSKLTVAQNGINVPINTNANYDHKSISKFYISANPFVGTKVVYNRIDYGVELNFLNLSLISSQLNGANRYTVPDFNMFANSSFRFYANFRF